MHPAAIAAREPDKNAIRMDSETRSYAELDTRSNGLASFMAQRGLKSGDVMALWAYNHIDFLTCCWAAQRSGLYYLPIAASLTPAEAAYILADSGATFLIVDEAHAGQLDGLLSDPRLSGLNVFVLAEDGPHALWKAVNETSATPYPAVEGADMLYTSGTTGRPKGVKRPLKGAALGSDVRRVERMRALFDMDAETVFLSPGPLYHAAPLRFSMTVLRLGGTVALLPRFDAREAIDALSELGVTHTQWVPTMFARLLALPAEQRATYDAPHHRKAIHAGAPCPRDIKQRMIDWFGPILHEYYSGTESIGFTHIDSAAWAKRPGSVGRAYGCDIHIVGETGEALPAGETGLVYFSGKGGLSYHNDTAKTAAAHNDKGWATMGDIGHLDEDGYLFLTDRQAFTIISGGVNVYPREVEDVLIAHPDVIDAAVVGVPDADFGESVQAVVQSSRQGRELAQSLFALCRKELAPFKRPKRIAFMDELPMTDSGKIKKRDLQARFAEPSDRGSAETREGTPNTQEAHANV